MTTPTATPPVLRLTDVSHTYSSQRRRTTVLKSIDYDFERSTFYTILGPSGSGKTTLLSLASGLDTPRRAPSGSTAATSPHSASGATATSTPPRSSSSTTSSPT